MNAVAYGLKDNEALRESGSLTREPAVSPLAVEIPPPATSEVHLVAEPPPPRVLFRRVNGTGRRSCVVERCHDGRIQARIDQRWDGVWCHVHWLLKPSDPEFVADLAQALLDACLEES